MKILWITRGPNTYQTAILEGLRGIGVDVQACYHHGRYGADRRSMGWKDPELKSWEHYAKTRREMYVAVPDYSERVIMVAGFSQWVEWRSILDCIFHRQKWFVLTEGTRGRWQTRLIFRLFCWCINRFALRVFVEGGKTYLRQFIAGGVAKAKVVPFAYATMRPNYEGSAITKKEEGTTFVFAGEFCERKAVDVIASAWRQIRVEYPAAKLILAGGGQLKGLLANLEGAELVGAVPQEEIYRFISHGDVMLLPSRYDPWGVALVEGGMAGLAMVGSDQTGAAEALIEDGKNGFVVKAGDKADLLRVMRIYAADPALARRHGQAARLVSERTSGENLARVMLKELKMASELVAASFWEEHCTECGEPDCYRSCANYVKGRGGRCRRFEGGLEETILNEGVEVKFLPWGKLEAYFHGCMTTRNRAMLLERLMHTTAWVRRLFPKLWRSWRWRHALRGARPGFPTVWSLRMNAERDECLVLQIVDQNLDEVFRRVLELKSGLERCCSIQLPRTKDGFLFRIFAANGEGTGRIRIMENALLADPENVVDGSPIIKCVAWDLDGTLWDGTLSEGDDVRLREQMVDAVKRLDSMGVVNSICSKNDYAPTIAKLKEFGIEEYFVFPQINWGPKSISLKQLSEEMNIALDAMAFVDDREENRSDVRMNCPGVSVFAETSVDDLLEMVSRQSDGCLGSARRRQYRTEMARRGALAKEFSGDVTAFLAQSELHVDMLPVEGDRIGRCRELVQRTNQLTITAHRYDEVEFGELLSRCEARAIHVRDKYGDYGVVGFVAWSRERIEELVFSCRIANKGVEREVLEMLPRGLSIDVVATERNAPIRKIVADWKESHA